MSRIRTIKPAVHLDEELWDLEQESQLPIFRGFTGLWSEADREGRFEWRPRKLKAAILPYWDGDFSRVLDALTTRGFVVRYAVDGREYGVVRTFTRHQVINNRESESILPAPPPETPQKPPDHRTNGIDDARVDDACSTREVHARVEGKGREGKGTEALSRARVRDPSPPEQEHDPAALPIARRQLWELGYQRRYIKKLGNPCPSTPKFAEHLSTIVRWSFEAKITDAGCESMLDAFFADTDSKVLNGKFWIGFMVPKLSHYAPGAKLIPIAKASDEDPVRPRFVNHEADAQMRRDLNGGSQAYEAPPALDALIAKVGKRVPA